MKIVLYSNKHRTDDNRIVELEAVNLAKSGMEVIVYAHNEKVKAQYGGIEIKQCKEKSKDCLAQCLNENADIYIFHDPGLLYCAVKLQHRGKKCIFDAHENYEEKLKTRLADRISAVKPFRGVLAKIWWLYEKYCVNQLSAKICADRTVQHKYGKNTFILPNMPSKEFFENLPERSVGSDIFTLVYVGTITWDRGIIETAKAIQNCKHRNVQLQVIGDTEDQTLKEKITSYPNVIWNGRVEWRKLKDHLVNADIGVVLLQPTEAFLYYPGENIVKLWEYMSIGLPVLISGFPQLVELNKELEFGYTVKPDDIDAIARQIDWMIDHQDEIKEKGKNGRNQVITKYNAENYTEGFVSFLGNL